MNIHPTKLPWAARTPISARSWDNNLPWNSRSLTPSSGFAPSMPLAGIIAVQALLLVAILSLVGLADAAPLNGERFTYRQPDGEEFPVRLWGDEYFAYQETEDGYLIVRDEKTGEFCYAKVTGNGDIVSTGVRVGKAKPPGLKAKQRITPARAMEKGRARRDASGVDENGQIKPELREKFLPKNGRGGKPGAKGGGKPATPGSKPESATQPAPDGSTSQYAPSDATSDPSAAQPAPEQTSGGIAYAPGDPSAIDKRVGLVLLAYFPDKPGDVTRTMVDIDAFCNAPTYAAGTLATSVYGYFNLQSNGRVEYKNVVTAWFMANNPRSFYANDNLDAAIGSQALIQEGLNKLQASGFDFTQCDADNNNVIDGVNIMYAGQTPSSWTRGLWPHKSADSWSGFAAQGLSTSFQYQITDMPATLPLGTFCHEYGHMLFDFPDLYQYNGNAAGLGNYSLMSAVT